MSGAEDLARLTQTIDTANELFLSDEIKMVDVGGGTQRPTNAKVLADLSTQMSGALIYTSTSLGLAGTVSGGYFSVLSSADNRYVSLYRNDAGVATYIDDYPNAEATMRAEGLAKTAYDLTFPKSLAEEMPWAIVDQFLRVILGVKANGAVHAILDRLPGLDLIGDYSWAITDTNGVVLLGIKWSGEVVIYGQSTGAVSAYADGPVGGQDIWVLVDGVPYQVTSSGDNFSPQVNSGRLSYVRRSGPVSSVTVDLPASGSIAAFVTTLLHVVGGGQSLVMGANAVVTTTQPPTANRLLTLQDGVRMFDQDATLTAAMVAPFKPLVAKTQEVPIVQLVAQLNRIRGLPSNAAVLASVHGRGGYRVNQLNKGTLYYANSITAVIAAKAEATRLGYAYRVPFIDWIQGEADRNMASGGYLAAMLQLQADYDADIRAASGQPEAVPILLDQISNWTAYGGQTSYVPLDQLQAAIDYPSRFYCAGPKYWFPTVSDGIHLPFDSSMKLGCMRARASQAIIDGRTWLPTHAISAVRSGAVIRLQFHTPSWPLVIDTTRVTDPGNWGIRYVDDAQSASVQSVRHVGGNTIEVTLSAVPTGGNPYIGIADIGAAGAAGGPSTGARSCLRDSSPDLDGYGNPVFNWACHQRINVKAA
ncbi:hypothetical protein [Pseudomonas putida]|uniref:hypothetical protein n=1 Tax=Pseudomonas putida TaxID=303 RepID=UPI0021192647|nr:hypothetical protein [Pseudomonas putida]